MPEIDMSIFSPAVILANGIKAMTPDVAYMNEIELRGYASAIENWRLNKNAGHPAPIPEPPFAYELVIDLAQNGAYLKRGAVPVCAKWVEPAPEPPPSKAAAIVPPFAPGRYLCVLGDNAPAGYRLVASDGVLVEKYVTLTPFGPMPEYRKVG